MVNIIEVLSRYDGVARAKHLAAAGVSDFQLKAAMASGVVSRVSRSVYALPGADALPNPPSYSRACRSPGCAAGSMAGTM